MLNPADSAEASLIAQQSDTAAMLARRPVDRFPEVFATSRLRRRWLHRRRRAHTRRHRYQTFVERRRAPLEEFEVRTAVTVAVTLIIAGCAALPHHDETMGLGLPFFFVPLTALALGIVKEHETASAAGLMNFIRTLFGAVATSIVTTVWDDKTTSMHAELAGLVDRSGEAARQLFSMGLSNDGVRSVLNNLTQSQSVMLATNEIMACVAVVFGLAAMVIWLAPRPTRKVDMTQAGH